MALLVTLMAATLMMGLGAGLVLLTTTEQWIAAHFAAGIEAFYAADAAIERAIADLAVTEDWAGVVNGSTQSTFADGPQGGIGQGANGTRIDLAALTNLERCGSSSAGFANAERAACDDGHAARLWQLYAYGTMDRLLGAADASSSTFVVVWVAPRDAESVDVLLVRARAFGRFGARRAVEVTILRSGGGLHLLAWREL